VFARSLICILGIIAGDSLALASSPSLSSITPRGGQRGTEMVLVFSGARLGDAKEILCYAPGVEVCKLETVNDNQVKATIRLAADCRLGEHALRVRTATGVSDLRTFWVGALPIVDEKEPNSDFAAPQKIPLNVTVHGTIGSEDVDYFLVEAKKGQRLSAEVEGMRLGTQMFDPYVAILDSKRFELAASDDTPLLGQDCAVSIIVPEDGNYIIQVRESAYGGNGAPYRLHVGTFPRPLAVVPAGGKLGEEVEVTFLGDPAGPFKQKIKLPATPDSRFGVFAQDDKGISPSPVPFRLSTVGNSIEAAPNDSHANATPAEVPGALNGVVGKPGEVDHFVVKGKKGQTFDFHCYARRLGSPLDSVMTLAVRGGAAVITNDDSGGPDSYFRYTFPDDREYVVSVRDHLGKGGPTYFYRIEVIPVQPLATVSIPKVALYSQERQSIAVPRGNRFGLLMSVSRAGFGGDMTLTADKLPPGVTLLAENLPANMDVLPVVFEAKADAPIGCVLAPLTAKHVDPKQDIPSRFLQTAELIVGNPGQSIYRKYDIEQAAIAVTEEAPFSIQLVEPKVPLVQNGSMSLKIVAQRKPGFTAPITITPFFQPSGVSTATSVTIPENGTEALFPINASATAVARKWKYAVNASATVGNGPLWVASQLITLEVAPPYVTIAMDRPAAEQGKSTEMVCKVQVTTPFTGAGKVRVLGLPNKVQAPELDVTGETKELVFKIDVDMTSPAGKHRNIFCQVILTQNGEPIVQNTGSTELRIDVPLPPKPNQPAPPATPVVAKPAEPNKPAEKRLSRLEKLRLEQEEREKAAKLK